MLQYSALDNKTRRDLPYTHQFTLHGLGNVAYSFQKSYSSFLASAVDACQRKRAKELSQESQKYTVWKLDTPDLEIFILRRVNRILGDVAILKKKDETDAYIIFYGESMKANLNEGIADFLIKGTDIKAELKEMIDAWDHYTETAIPKPTDDNRHADLRFIESTLEPVDNARDLVIKYLYKVNANEESAWRNQEYYKPDLSGATLPRPQNIQSQYKPETP